MESLSGFFRYCFSLLDSRQKRDFYLLLVLGLASAFAELVGLAAIVPVISLLVGGESNTGFAWLQALSPFQGATDQLLTVGMISITLVVLAALIHLLYTYALFRYVRRVAASLSTRVFHNYLQDTLEKFLQRSQSSMVRNVGEIGDRICNDVLQSGIHIVTRAGLLILVLIWLLTVSPELAAVICTTLGVIYFGVHGWVKSYIEATAERNFQHYKGLHQLKVDAYQGIRQVRIDSLDDSILSKFNRKKVEVCRGEANIAIVGEVPRFVLEACGISLLILSAMYMNEVTAQEYLIPNMAVFALAAYRILPAVQQIYHCITRLTAAQALFADVVDGMAERDEIAGVDAIVAADMPLHYAELSGVEYVYPNAQEAAIADLSCVIPLEGLCLVSGPSGIGKSTLFDLMLGLRKPDKGVILVDGEDVHQRLTAWWREISYIPQNFHIFGRSIRDVITSSSAEGFNQDSYDKALRVSGLDVFLERRSISDVDHNIETLAVSGGERCRLALARALYSHTRVVFMDEPFAALDFQSARDIVSRMQAEYPARCFIIISHRLEEIEQWDHLLDFPALTQC